MPQPSAPFVTPVATATFAAAGRPASMVHDTTPTILQANNFVFDIPAGEVWSFALDAATAGDLSDTFTSLLNGQQAGPPIVNQFADGTDTFDIFLPAGTYTYNVVLTDVAASLITPVDFGFSVTVGAVPSITSGGITSTSFTAFSNPAGLAAGGIFVLGGGEATGLVWGIRVSGVGSYTDAAPSASDSHAFSGLAPGTTYDVRVRLTDGTVTTGAIATTTISTTAAAAAAGDNSQMV